MNSRKDDEFDSFLKLSFFALFSFLLLEITKNTILTINDIINKYKSGLRTTSNLLISGLDLIFNAIMYVLMRSIWMNAPIIF